MEQITIDIDTGLHCSSCERRLQTLLLRVPGVRQADVSHVLRKAEVHYNPHAITAAELIETMERGGFKAAPGIVQ